jgi:hypothetical protein
MQEAVVETVVADREEREAVLLAGSCERENPGRQQ